TRIERSSITAASQKINDANSIISPHFQWRLYIAGLLTADVVTTFAAFWLAYYLRFEWFVRPFDPNAVDSFEHYRLRLYAVPFLWLTLFAVNGLYVRDNLLGGTREYAKVFTSA